MNRKGIRLAAIIWALILSGSACWGLENQIINGEFDAGVEPWQRSAGALTLFSRFDKVRLVEAKPIWKASAVFLLILK